MEMISGTEAMALLKWKHTRKHFYGCVRQGKIPHALRVGRAVLFDARKIRELAARNRRGTI
mgnify:CR=1 FL=1